MAVFFYNVFLLLFNAGIRLASLFDTKAGKWVAGRRDIFARLRLAINGKGPVIWVHCASLGEFEQGRPLIERLKIDYPSYKILLTFFSPSGYEVQKDYKQADWVFYLPMDGPRNAKEFLEIVQPSLVIFVKYEFWYYYLKKLKYRDIPLLLVSALFREDMSFFKWYGALQRKMLSRFDHLFVQNAESKVLVDRIGLSNICTVSGDTRFDRVTKIADGFTPIPAIEQFIAGSRTLIAGSTWKEDEVTLQKSFSSIADSNLKLIIAPHEIDSGHTAELKKLFPQSVLYSELAAEKSTSANCLIIDNFGMLSRLYYYGHINFVGGGFRKSGVHNVLEAAVYGKPVLYGPEYVKYTEAVELVRTGGGICVKDDEETAGTISKLLNDEQAYRAISLKSKEYVRGNTGATEKIVRYIQEKRLLTI
ncbi:MAG: 3-deoxy-D-manno-octulosonic acid transferase [Chitinophagaceae bacterium]|nr:3-deoxy-D-manno-octulosonic acid transferase [Chitinophagaceae bacterium]